MASIQGIYLALFGRPADPSGLEYFNTVTNNGADLTAIGDLATTMEYQNRFAGKTNAEIITTIYQTLFGRDPEQAGLDFFLQALANGTYTMQNIAIAILDGAQGDDLVSVNNKIAAANEWVTQLDTTREQGAYVGNLAEEAGRIFISRTDTDPNSVPGAEATQAAIDELLFPSEGQGPADGAGGNGNTGGGGAVAQTFNLTTNQDNAVGGDANDTINGLATGVFGTSTLQNTDVINGGGGEDTINITETGAVDLNAASIPTLTNMEIINITADGQKAMGENRILVDTALMPQATRINMVDGISDIELTNLTLNGITFGMSGNANDSDFVIRLIGGDTGTNDSIDIYLGGNPDSDDITVHGSRDAAANGGAETMNIWSTGAINMVSDIQSFDNNEVDILKNLFVRGDKKLIAADFDGSITFVSGGLYDGSAATGEQDVSFRTAAGPITVNGGSANDRIIFDAIEATDTIDGAGGTNTIGIFGNVAVAAGGLAGVTNADNFEITGLSTAQQDVDIIGLFNTYIISSFGDGASFLNLANNANVLISDDTAGTTQLTLKADTGADELNIRLDNGSDIFHDINDLDVSAGINGIVETVNIQLGAAGGDVRVFDNNILATTINITGDEHLEFCELHDSVQLLNAENANGDIIVASSQSSKDTSTINTGVGDDIVELQGDSGGDVTASLGSGDDIVVVFEAQEHNVTLGTGSDIVVFDDIATAGATDTVTITDLAEELTITDFETGADQILFGPRFIELVQATMGNIVDGTNYFEGTLGANPNTVDGIQSLATSIANDQAYLAAIEIGDDVHLFYDINGKNVDGGVSEIAILKNIDLMGVAVEDFGLTGA